MPFALIMQTIPAYAAEKSDTETNNRAEYLGMKLYTGELHSHTSISDGVLFPEDAVKHVAKNTNLDFYSTSEHDVTFDITTGNDYLERYIDSYSEEYKFSRSELDRLNSDSLVTVPGVEVTWYDNAGHINLFNTEWFPRTTGEGATGQFGMGQLMYDLPTFYGRLAEEEGAIAQFNHPDAKSKGNFNGFRHLNKDIDDNVTLFEYKVDRYFDTFVQALDNGWHLSPSYGGDEHTANWGSGNPALTGVWTDELTRESIYDAMANRRTYVTFDENFELGYSANGKIMGSIITEDTKELTLNATLKDPDTEDLIDNVTIYTNNGKIVKEYKDINSNEFVINETVPTKDGEYFFVRTFQKDGDEILSAPIWVGEKTKGTNYAPDITIEEQLPTTVQLGSTVEIPPATSIDDSGETPTVKAEVFYSKGMAEVVDNKFKIEEYGEYFVRYKATDSAGNARVKTVRILVDDTNLDGNKILNEFAPTVNVGATENEVGITLVTDKALKKAYVQYKPVAEENWANANVIETEVSYFESAYGENIDKSNYRILASHEADLSGLQKGTEYEYRFGITSEGPWENQNKFETAPESEDTTIYIMGDLQVPDRNPESFKLYRDMLDVLKQKKADGKLMIQVGDLVNSAGMTETWTDVFKYIYKDLNLLSANMIGNHEVIQDVDASSYRNFFNLPDNGEGTYTDGNYSFDYGEAHIAVLNSMDFNDEQLKWLEKDMRATDKKWKIVMGHFPYYGGSHSDDAGMSTGRAQITKKMQQLGISLYIGGHDHVYKRTTIRDGVMNNDQEAMNLGTTFITMGSSGPKFYDNEVYEWDNVVYDEDVQTGVILETNENSLTIKAYNNAGTVIDEFTLTPPESHLELSSVDVEDGAFNGVGILNYPNSTDKVTVVGATYDATGTKLIDAQTKEVTLEGLGREQLISFDKPLVYNDQNIVKLFVWDNLTNQKPIFPSVTVREAMDGEGTAENPYKIDSIQDFDKIQYYPDKHFVLTEDIIGNQDVITAIGSDAIPFSGVFDGNGHFIKGVEIATIGAGLFRINNGTIKNIAVLDANVTAGKNDVGLLVDVNNGTIENSYTTGSITGLSTVGGLVGMSNGVIRNSYSTANVKATAKQAGGLVGITREGSTTENVYATGSVTAGSSNAGGISGYGYENTIIQNSAALNTSVITTSAANRIVGRVLAGETATLENNIANNKMIVSKEAVTLEDASNEKGLSKTQEELKTQSTYEDLLQWNFESVWAWDEIMERPVLMQNRENAENNGASKPALDQDDNGFYMIKTADDLMQINQYLNENYILQNDIDLTGKVLNPIGVDAPFMGTLDGNGKKLINFKSTSGALFHLHGGSIYNIAMINADVTGEAGAPQTGVLVSVNSGTIENSYSTGKVTGSSTVGGLVGYSNGVIRNSYSNADVTATGSQAGGLVGITNSGSLTENVYATGNVNAIKSNAGGISGYAYNKTAVKNAIALNTSVTSPYANRVLGRIYSGHTPILENNFSYSGMMVDIEKIKDNVGTSVTGLGKTKEEIETKEMYSTLLGWNFETVWAWDEVNKVPVLQSNAPVGGTPGEEPEIPVDAPNLEKDSNENYKITSIKDIEELSKYPAESYILAADLDYAGITDATPIATFSGNLDGNGKTIKNFTSTGGGFINLNEGTIKNLAIVDADITAGNIKAGILANTNKGSIESSYTTGQITGNSTASLSAVGGLVGESTGAVKNTYSIANVTAKANQAGGLIGITIAGSNTENSYATGIVNALIKNAGGISGYAYKTTSIKNTIALNDSVSTVTSANRVVGKTGSNAGAILENYAKETMSVAKKGIATDLLTNENGQSIEQALYETKAFYVDTLKWDFETVWAWDEVNKVPVLQSNMPVEEPPVEQPEDPNVDNNGNYKISSIQDLEEVIKNPAGKYILTADLDFAGITDATPIVTFSGVLDGNGKVIKNYTSTTGGFINTNEGTIKNLAMVDAEITTGNSKVGIMVNVNKGTIENSYSTGKIIGNSTVGGLVGESVGTVKNAYSLANVKAKVSQAGGLIGITNVGSTTENSYATGMVSAASSNAGGLSGYAYTGTTIQNSVSLNKLVNTASAANRVVGKIKDTPTLVNNSATTDMLISTEGQTVASADNEKGMDKSQAELKSKGTFESIGWDFDNVWMWDTNVERPVLKVAKEQTQPIDSESVPSLTQDENGFYMIETAEDLQVINSFPNANYILQNDLDLNGTTISSLAIDAFFTGTFDGNGKKITNFTSTRGALFDLNAGTIKNIGIENATVTGANAAAQTGILVNLNFGTVENSYSTGAVTGNIAVGGLVGYSNGIILNSYSSANVTATGNQAGGLVGMTNSGSITENVYASGNVTSSANNAGGITGYAYNNTTVKNVIALNASVKASYANRIVGRVASGQTATLENNFANELMTVDKKGIATNSLDNQNGQDVSLTLSETQAFYADTLKWNFETVWKWNEEKKLPVLRAYEPIVEAPIEAPIEAPTILEEPVEIVEPEVPTDAPSLE